MISVSRRSNPASCGNTTTFSCQLSIKILVETTHSNMARTNYLPPHTIFYLTDIETSGGGGGGGGWGGGYRRAIKRVGLKHGVLHWQHKNGCIRGDSVCNQVELSFHGVF
jgi:hypothetical protein